jgi:hypothetical protein
VPVCRSCPRQCFERQLYIPFPSYPTLLQLWTEVIREQVRVGGPPLPPPPADLPPATVGDPPIAPFRSSPCCRVLSFLPPPSPSPAPDWALCPYISTRSCRLPPVVHFAPSLLSAPPPPLLPAPPPPSWPRWMHACGTTLTCPRWRTFPRGTAVARCCVRSRPPCRPGG